MKWLKKRFQKVWISVGVILSLVLTLFSGISFVQPGQVEAEETEEVSKELSNPRIVPDSSMEAGQKVTWDCVWFGSYPQAEVVPAGSEYTALPEELLQEGDLIQDDALYQTLQSATGWNWQGDIVLNNEKYRRIKKKNATYTSSTSGFYNWKSEIRYHYFKYQPIKWRVLSVNGSEAFLLADKVLDDKQYHTENEGVTWEGSTIRSWLNGYSASSNIQNQDYNSNNFIDTAFGISGQQAINEAHVENKDIFYYGEVVNDTHDKVFLLSKSETYTNTANRYGFVSAVDKYDEARRAGSSVYAKAMGICTSTSANYVGNCDWLLRSLGDYRNRVARVNNGGCVYSSGLDVVCNVFGVRPALNLSLTVLSDSASSNLWSYAGTMCSDGTVNEIKPENTPELSLTVKPSPKPETDKKLSNPLIKKDASMKAGQKVTWDCIWFGNYPQAEVVPASSEYTAFPEEYLKDGDLIQDDILYQTLQSVTGWDEQGDIVVSGEKYRRITKENIMGASNILAYEWKNETEYHYFKYQPIKWRVLSINGSEMFLLADKVLDDKQYHTKNEDVTWEGSTIRSWLNGYSASSNIQNQDYNSNNFIDTAFGISGQQAIKETLVENNTEDKIFLFSGTDAADRYGFVLKYGECDEALLAVSSVYAKAMGAFGSKNCIWWLRSSGICDAYGKIFPDSNVDYNLFGVRPALNLNLTVLPDAVSSNLWSYAGTVCSDGTVNEIKSENMPEASPSAEPTETPEASPSAEPTNTPEASPSAGPTNTPEASPSAEPESTPEASPSAGSTKAPEASPSTEPPEIPEADKKLSNPRIVPDSSMEAGQKVTWDCVWFGSYPQAEVVPDSSEYTALPKRVLKEGDLIRDDVLYQTLQSATGWDEQDDIVVSGEKYRRIKKDNVTATSSIGIKYYNWESETEYHYFKYQPIKWRVLSVNDSEAFLLADKALDCKPYHTKFNTKFEHVTWEGSTIRSWLNGYNASANIQNQDYSSKNFIDTAFRISGQQAIKETYVENKDSLEWDTDGGNDTWDKVFLLSKSETYTDVANEYGFISECINDEARQADSSVYAKAMGTDCISSASYLGSCYWWLRSPGYSSDNAAEVTYGGWVYGSDNYGNYNHRGVRPALNLNLIASPDAASSNLWSYAGTMCSDGTVNEIKPENTPEVSPSSKPTEIPEAGKKLSNPCIEYDSSMKAGQKVTWDCVWFGSYPQAEVVPASSEYTALSEKLLKEGDLIQDDALYQILQSATGWDEQGDIMVSGEKYRRITKWDAINIDIGYYNDYYYKWESKTEYHYFKYQPIKWRVLSVNGSRAFLLADKVLDDKEYHVEFEDVTWEGSTIRSWLNGYNNSLNIQNQDYSSKNFIDTAFGISGQQAIKETYVKNKNNLHYGEDGGNNTQDKVFLLSESETYTDTADGYGFVFTNSINDEARMVCSSVYAKAMGTESCTSSHYAGNCDWWLRSPSHYKYVPAVGHNGMTSTLYSNVTNDACGVRPALNLNLTASSNLWSYAGKVCSDGTVNEIKPENKPTPKPATPFIPYNVPSGGGSVNVPTQTPDSTVLPTVSPAPTDVPVVPQTPKPAETGSSPVPETDNKPSQTNAPGSIAKPDEETGNNSNIDNSDIDNSNTDNTNNSGNIKISKGSMVTDKKTKAVYKVTKNGKKNTVQYINNTKKNASSVTIPNKIKINGKSYKVDSIGKGAFKNNKKLKKIKIGKNIKTIGKGAFAGCKNLTDVEIGENVTEIKENAFSKCTSLVMVTIPAKVNKIGNRAFYKCKNLQYILVKSNKLMESNIGKEVFSGGFSTPRIKTDKSKWELYQKIFTARGMSQKALYIIDPVKLIP